MTDKTTDAQILAFIDELTPKDDRNAVNRKGRPLMVWRKEGDVRVREPTTRGLHEHAFVRLNEADFCHHFRQLIGDEQLTPDNLIGCLFDLHDNHERYGAEIIYS
jgi:hypothetical protein